MIHKIKGIALHYIQMSYTIDGQIIAKIDASGKLKYKRYEDVDEVQILMTRWLTKKLVATTVSSREKGLERRNETVTTNSHTKPTKNNQNSNLFQQQ